MKVLIDCTQITRNKAGVGVYAQNLVEQLLKRRDSATELILLVQDDDPDFSMDSALARRISIPSRMFRSFPLRLVMEQLYIPWLARRLKVDVIHSLHYSFPLLRTGARKIVTVHDMTSFIMPEVHTWVKRHYFHFFIRAAARLADGILFVSNSTKTDWTRYFQSHSMPTFVTPLGKSNRFRPDLSEESVRAILDRLKIPQPYILYLGTIEPRKNLVRLVSSFARLASAFPAHTLVIAGMKGWMYGELFATVDRLKLRERVIFTGFVAEEDKPYLMSAAEVFVYPSLYEGFGIPVVESLACGIPTVTSQGSSLGEVAGDAALLAEPTNIDSITGSLRKVLSDPALRERMREQSVKQASRFDWRFTADGTLAAYRRVAGTPRA